MATLAEPETQTDPLDAFRARLTQLADRDVVSTRATDYVRPTAHRGGIRPTAHWGGGMIAMLVPTPANHRRLAIGIGGPAQRLDEHSEEIIADLRSETGRLAEQAESF